MVLKTLTNRLEELMAMMSKLATWLFATMVVAITTTPYFGQSLSPNGGGTAFWQIS
jgi:hypothetical protein